MLVIPLEAAASAGVDAAGGKGANLASLLQAGFRVPPGFVIGAGVYRTALADLFGSEPGDSAPEKIAAALQTWPFPASLDAEIADAHAGTAGPAGREVRYAVRSSATAEDLADASFAGQHDTYYNVSPSELGPWIRSCWASLWKPEAVDYRRAHGIADDQVAMAVVVQELIEAETAGITFTTNPLTGVSAEIVTDAVWGMGSAIVDGRVTPDHFVVARESLTVTTRKIANQPFMASAQAADGKAMVDVAPERRGEPCLTDVALREISEWAIRAEEHFGSAQDLEWARRDGTLYLLQSRPITTLAADPPPPDRKLVIYKPISENFTDPLLPMSQDILQAMVPQMVMHKGRIYHDVVALRAFAPLHLTDEEAAGILCGENTPDLRIRVRLLMVPVCVVAWGLFYLFSAIHQARTRAMPDEFMEACRDHARRIDEDESLSPLAAMAKLLIAPGALAPSGMRIIFVNVTAVTRYFLLMGVLNVLLKRWYPDVPRDAGSLLCSGSTGVLSTEMGRSIAALAVTAKREEQVVQILQAFRGAELMPALRANAAAGAFLAELDAFLAVHGHRTVKEFELGSPRFEEDPSPVLAMVRNYLETETDPAEMEQRTTDRRVALAESIEAKLRELPLERRWQPRWRIISYLADRARYFIKLRENSRFFHIMGWNAARKKILRAERRLLKTGKLKMSGDIFYLQWAEVRALAVGALQWVDVEGRIRERRMQHLRWSRQPPERTLNVTLTQKAALPEVEGQLLGQGAAPGSYEGVARVILDPRVDAELRPGEVLVAPYTDPAWTPLFLIARAAVVGVGSYLSHAGTIAREYGMPCVVDVSGCTERIRTGDRVRVDGTNGTVQVLTQVQGHGSVTTSQPGQDA